MEYELGNFPNNKAKAKDRDVEKELTERKP